MRKAVGASKSQLVFQFLSEALLISFISLFIAMILVAAALPYFSVLVGKNITTDVFFQPTALLNMIIITSFIGLLSGVYPAFYISSYKPNDVLKGKGSSATKGKAGLLRRMLITFQFAISIALVICTGILYQQMNYIHNFDLGFNEEQVVVVEITDPVLRTQYRNFKTRTLQIPTVRNVTASFSAPADLVNMASFRPVGTAADDNRLAVQGRIVAFFDRRIERVAIHMRNRQIEQLRMRQHARAAAGRATPRGFNLGQTVAAKGWHKGHVGSKRDCGKDTTWGRV